MAKTPEQKATEAQVAEQLKKSQQRAKMPQHRRDNQNERVAQRILRRGRGK